MAVWKKKSSVLSNCYSPLRVDNFKARDAIDLVSWSHASKITLVIHTILLINENKKYFLKKLKDDVFNTHHIFNPKRRGGDAVSKPPHSPRFSQTYYGPTFPSVIFIWAEIPWTLVFIVRPMNHPTFLISFTEMYQMAFLACEYVSLLDVSDFALWSERGWRMVSHFRVISGFSSVTR